jgi:Ca-activated chloride channel family protein
MWLFIALAVTILLFFKVLLWKKKTRKKIGDKNLVNALTSTYSSRLFTGKFILFLLAFALGIITVMNPGKIGGKENINRKGIDVAIALDVSKSMLVTDIAPSRLERAKQFISKLMSEMPDDRIALVLFAGKAYLQMPLTTDHGAAKLFVSSAGPNTIPAQGTVISDALKMSANAFSNTEKRYKAVVLISDGEDHDQAAMETATELSQQGVMINTIGIGSPEGATITDPVTGQLKTDETGNTVISKLNEDELKQIATATNGVYVRLESSDETVSLIKEHLSQIEKKAFGDVSQINFNTWYWWFAGLMFILLLLEIFLPETKRSVIKEKKLLI